MIADRYYYDKLSQANKIIYKKVYDSIVAYQTSCTLDMTDAKMLKAIIEAIILDNPYLFYLGKEYSVTCDDDKCFTLNLTYCYSEDEILKYQAKIKSFVNHIVNRLIGITDEYILEKKVHDYLVTNLTYSQTETCDNHNIIGVVIRNKSVCDGIAKTTKMIFNALNIKCIIVNGKDSKGVGHSWNIVKIKGSAYHIDITWDLNRTCDDSVNYDYFNLCDKDIQKDHVVPSGVPLCSSIKHNYFFIAEKEFYNLTDLLFALCQINLTKTLVYYFKWRGKKSTAQLRNDLLNHFIENPIDDYCQIRISITVNPTQSTMMVILNKTL